MAAWMRATISGEGESEVMYHAAATFCIHVPMLETSAASQRSRKTRCRSGPHADVDSAGDAAPPGLVAVCGVSATIDLAACVKALQRRSNVPYEWNFVRNLKGRMRRKAAAFPGAFSLDPLKRIWTVRQFDEAYTAPHHGFRDADDYYYRASAMRVIDCIRVPALIITAEDDPFVPVEAFRDPSVTSNPNITLVVTPHGGHCAYVERGDDAYDGYWAEREIVRFIDHHVTRRRDAASAASRTPAPSLPLRA